MQKEDGSLISNLRAQNDQLETQLQRLNQEINSQKIDYELRISNYEKKDRGSGSKESELFKQIQSYKEAEQIKTREIESLKLIVEEYKSTIKGMQEPGLNINEKDKKIANHLAEIQQLRNALRDSEDQTSKLQRQISEMVSKAQRLEDENKKFEEEKNLQSLKQSNFEARRFAEVTQTNSLKKKQEDLLNDLSKSNKNY